MSDVSGGSREVLTIKTKLKRAGRQRTWCLSLRDFERVELFPSLQNVVTQ